jgi:hypothetical protein
MKAEMSPDGKIITVTIPMKLGKRGGRKMIIAPDGQQLPPELPVDDSMARLVAKAHVWLKILENGGIGSIKALAEKENLDHSYVAKVLRLTLLSPDIVKLILDNQQPDIMTWRELSRQFPSEWSEQRERWGIG